GLARQLLDGTPGPHDVVRARSLGLDLDSPVRAVVVRPSTGPTPNAPSRTGTVGPAAVVREELAAQGIRVVAIRPDEVTFLAGDGAALDAVLTGLAQPGRAVGVGRAQTGAAGAARSYAEARQAVVFAEGLDRPVVRHEDLGLFSLLADGGDPRPMAALVVEWLGPLLATPKLLSTLAAYLDAGAAQQASADALGVHVSTLKYRLGRIEEVTGRDLSAPDVRFQLQVALAVHRTLSVLQIQGD
ncbi:MAG TPA: helix-turn-helix domain-containing protein, partial [Acidimicrobiia bacterium]|nr:helix-turn-helix domain-containing protein [Acidimicrobiia bacterium]